MIRTRGRKIIGDVFERKGRTLLVSAAIFIGVLGTIALFSMSDIIITQLREDIKEDELSMLSVFVSVNVGEELDNQLYLDELQQLPGVTEVIGSTFGGQVLGYFKISEDDEEFEQGELISYSMPLDQLPIEPMRVIEGAYPQEGANEFAIEQRMAEEYNLAVGDQLYFRVLSPSRDESLGDEIGTIEAWTISGVVFHAYAFSPNQSMYFASVDDANYLSATPGFSTFSARFVDFPTAEEQQDDFATYIADETPYHPYFQQPQDPAANQLITGAQTLASTMSFLALLALIVSGFLVINVISSIVIEQKRQIGVMKSMGASRYDNFVIYAGIAFVYGLIAVIPAVILGIPAGNAASHALAPELNTVIDGFKISPGSIILGILVGLLIPVLSSLIPVYFGTRVQILDAMTDLGIDANYGSGPIARLINILPVPITVRQGFSNVSLKKSRLVFTVITLAIAAGAFMGIFAVFSSLTGGINTFLDTFNVEVAIFPNQGRDPDEITTLLVDNFASGDDAILNSVEPGFQLQVEFEGYDPPATAGGPPGIFAYGYDITSENPSFVFTVDEGEPLTEENAADGIIFSSLLAQNMDRNVGDRVVLKVPGNSAELTIVGISDFVLDQVWLDWRTLALISGSTFSEPVESRFPIPDDAAAFIQYAAPVAIGQDEAVALALTPQAASFLASFITDGEMYSAGAPGVIISSELADANSYDIGDALTLESTAEDGGSGDYTVTGIIELPAQFQGEDLPSNFVAMSWENLATLDGLSLEGKPRPQGFFITTTLDDPSATELDGVIDDLNEVMLENGIPVSAFNFVELTDQISAAFTTIQVILQAVASLIALVGALGLLTTLSMSVFERQKEIGVMRSIGASSGTVVTQFLTEGLVVGIIAWIVGLPLAYLIEVGLLSVTGFDETFPAVFPVSAAIIGLVGMLLITALASLWPSLSAARKTVSDILRYQ